MIKHNTVILDPDKCKGCITCMKRCPTEAIRVRNGKASVMYERCIGCGECVRLCPHQAKLPSYDPFDIIKDYSKKDYRIQYLGLLSRSEVISWQKKATVLVNPRHANEEYTRYSFPSKTIEYLASGTPIVMFRLGCMTEEYDSYIFYADSDTIEGLRDKLIEICNMPKDDLKKFGERARNFILTKKTPKAQCQKILNLMKGF